MAQICKIELSEFDSNSDKNAKCLIELIKQGFEFKQAMVMSL